MEKQRRGRVREEKPRSEKIREEKEGEDAGARKSRKVTTHCVFPMIWGSGGSKSNLAKAAGAEPAGQMRDEKLHAVVARSTFPSQNAQSKPGSVEMSKKCTHWWREARFQAKKCKKPRGSDHLRTFRCRKRAHRCGAKHVSKSKV